MTWQTIEVAPTGGLFDELDGELFEFGPDLLLWDGVTINIGAFEEGKWFIRDVGVFHPTHWMPLPEAPEAAP